LILIVINEDKSKRLILRQRCLSSCSYLLCPYECKQSQQQWLARTNGSDSLSSIQRTRKNNSSRETIAFNYLYLYLLWPTKGRV